MKRLFIIILCACNVHAMYHHNHPMFTPVHAAPAPFDAALVLAAGNGDIATVQTLATPINVNGWNPHDGSTALLAAARSGHTAIVQYLLHIEHIDVNGSDFQGRTPLMIAAQEGHLGVVQALLGAQGILVNDMDHSETAALPLAVLGGHLQVVLALLNAGADPRVRTFDQVPLLNHAVSAGDLEIVRCLLALPGASVNVSDSLGSTPLMIADDPAMIELLLTAGADANAHNNAGSTVLMGAAFLGNLAKVQRLLAIPGINFNQRTHNGATALKDAVQWDHIDIVQTLLTMPGIDLEAHEPYEWPLLRYARTNTMRALLIAHGAHE